jgi:hypothetical protein
MQIRRQQSVGEVGLDKEGVYQPGASGRSEYAKKDDQDHN